MPTARESTTTGAPLPGVAPRRRAARSVVAGLTCAVGAMAAHVAAGGQVPLVAAALAVAASTALAPVLLGDRVDPARTLALSLVAQVVWHATFVLTTAVSGGTMSHHGGAVAMAGAHVLAAAIAAVVAAGAERALSDAADRMVGALLPAVVRAVALPTPDRRAPAYAALTRRPVQRAHDPARPLRAPPRAVSLG